MKKIYIIGPPGSGKTYFSKKLSEKYNIKCYQLDKVAWDDDNGNVKRTDEEALKIFNNILKDKSWIMEDIGRTKFKKGREEADIIYYIKISKIKAYFRVTKRWVKQRLGLETFNCPPKFKELIYFYTTVTSYYKKEKIKLNELNKYKEKLVFITKKDINNILKS